MYFPHPLPPPPPQQLNLYSEYLQKHGVSFCGSRHMNSNRSPPPPLSGEYHCRSHQIDDGVERWDYLEPYKIHVLSLSKTNTHTKQQNKYIFWELLIRKPRCKAWLCLVTCYSRQGSCGGRLEVRAWRAENVGIFPQCINPLFEFCLWHSLQYLALLSSKQITRIK